MTEWSVTVKLALGIILTSLFFSIVMLVVVVSLDAGNEFVYTQADKLLASDYSRYRGRELDKSTAKNLIRLNRERLPIVLGSASPAPIGVDRVNSVWVPEDNVQADALIESYLVDSTKYSIEILVDTNGTTIMWIR